MTSNAPQQPATSAAESAPPVPQVGPRMAWWQHVEMSFLLRVVGPIRRRRRRPALPPPLSAEETARRLFELPISYWTYDFEPGVRHLGPMAQDFAAAFGLGNTNRKVHLVDANGVSVVAVQVLHRRVRKLEREVERLRELLEGGPGAGSVGQPIDESVGAAHDQAGTVPASLKESVMDTNEARGPHDTDDVEGHRSYAISDSGTKHDVHPVESEDDASDDVEGHRSYAVSDSGTKHDVHPVESEDDASDTEEAGADPRG